MASYSTIDNAAVAALMHLLTTGDPLHLERLGAIIPIEQGYSYTEPQNLSTNKGTHSKAKVPANLVALFHNHPKESSNGLDELKMQNRFSEDDVKIANRLNKPSYIASVSANPILSDIYRYDPGTAAPKKGGVEGTPVLAEFPIEEFKKYLMRKILERSQDDPRGLLRMAPKDVDELFSNIKRNKGLLGSIVVALKDEDSVK